MQSLQGGFVLPIYAMLVFVLEVLMEGFVKSGSVEGIQKLSELLCLCRGNTGIRSARPDESDGEEGEGKEDEKKVLESRHYGSSRSVFSSQLRIFVCWVGRGGWVCNMQRGLLYENSLVDIS